MRELFDEVAAQSPLDPEEAVRRTTRVPHRKRFYKQADVTATPEGFAIALDGKPVPDAQRGPDLGSTGTLLISRSDLFHVLTGSAPRDGTIVLSVPAGFRLYTFTFG